MKFQNLAFIALSLPSIIHAAAFELDPPRRTGTTAASSTEVSDSLRIGEIIANLGLSIEDLEKYEIQWYPQTLLSIKEKNF